MTALTHDLDEYLTEEYNHDHDHTGRLSQGRVPADIVYGARNTSPDKDTHLSTQLGVRTR
jgi:hypothetical protein